MKRLAWFQPLKLRKCGLPVFKLCFQMGQLVCRYTEVLHRKALEDCPAVYDEDGLFDTSIVPWWVWVKRFHLPEAEKINGRAAMVGYAFAYVIDAAGGAGLVDLHQSFLGKTAIFLTVAFCLTVRKLGDIDTLGVLADEVGRCTS